MINGVNPTAIQQCVELPEEFKASEAEIFGSNTASNQLLKVDYPRHNYFEFSFLVFYIRLLQF